MGKKNKKGKRGALKEKMKKSETSKKEVKVNPFDLRINHERYNILGRKSKNDKGMPGVSRNKAFKKRKEFMFRNKLLTSKANCFVDKRIGEYDKGIPKEEQMAARLVYEMRKKLKRNIYNLNDDEELTHLGKPISMLDALDNPVSDSDEEEEDKLDANFVEEAHFGGFLTKKNSEEPSKTHMEIIGDLILESKRKKEEKKLNREKNLDLTDKLDKEWKELMSNIGSLKHDIKLPDVPKNDQYDMIVRELKFEPRGVPADKLKTPEELAKEEKEKLAKLEEERLLRMKDLTEVKKVSHQLMSADSIYDGLQLENDDFSVPSHDLSQEGEEPSELKNDKVEETSDCSGSETSQDEEEDMYSDLDSQNENEEMDSENEEAMDGENEEAMDGENEKEMDGENDAISEPTLFGSSGKSHSKFTCAATLEELLEVISTHCDNDVSVVVEGMMKCNHPSLGDGNRSKMESLFKTLLDYVDYIYQKGGDSGNTVVNSMVPHLYSLAQMSPLNCASTFRDLLLKKYELLQKQRKSAVHKKYCPHISSLILLKLCGILYSTSDFRHPVVIVAMLYMSEVLSHKFFVTYENLISRLFVSNLFYEYVALSKRFVPEAISLLVTVLFCSTVKDTESSKFCRGAYHGDQNLLLVTSAEECEPQKLNIKLFSDVPIQGGGKLKISLLDNSVKQLLLYVDLYSSLPSFPELFSPVRSLIKNLPVQYYPTSLTDSIKKLDDKILEVMARKRSYIVFPMKKPKPLKLFEPDFDLNFSGKKNNMSKKIKLAKELSRKCAREQKGVVREIRRDAQFLAHQQLQEMIEKDKERKQKVNKLFQDLALQQRDIKIMSKRKK